MRRRTGALGLLLVLSIASAAQAQPSQGDAVWVPTLHVSPQGEVELDLFEDGTAFAHNTADGAFWYSPTGGSAWTPRPPLPSAGGTPSMDFSSPDLGYAISAGQLFQTTDLGLTWQEIDSPSFDATWDEGLADISHFHVVKGTRKMIVAGRLMPKVDGCPVAPTKSTVFYGSPGRWRETKIPFHALPIEIEFLDKKRGVFLFSEQEVTATNACGYSSAGFRWSVMKTTDGGATLHEVFSVLQKDDQLLSVAMPTPRSIFLGLASGRVLRSTNGGRTFREVIDVAETTGTPGLWIDEITFADPRIGYLGTNGMGTWRTADGGRTWTEEASHQAAPGLNIGDLVAAGPTEALVGGPWAIARRTISP